MASKFTDAQKTHIKTELKEMLYYFGYTNPTAASSEGGSSSDKEDQSFKFDTHEADMLERHNKFIEHNEKILEKKVSDTPLLINGDASDCFDLIPQANQHKSQQPGIVWATKKLKYEVPTETTSKMAGFYDGGQFCR